MVFICMYKIIFCSYKTGKTHILEKKNMFHYSLPRYIIFFFFFEIERYSFIREFCEKYRNHVYSDV